MKIVLNDWLTDKIPLERGVRQDNPNRVLQFFDTMIVASSDKEWS